MESYLKSSNIEISDDPFKYWHAKQNFPNLKKLAQKFLSLVPATVPSERLFSTAGLIHTNLRNRLKPENLQILCFLNKNLEKVNFDY